MSRKITFTLSESSIREALLKIGNYKTQLPPAIRRATSQLMYDATDYLERILQIEQDPQDQRISISAEPTNNGFVLTITGDGVGFVEFGTGAYADRQHPFAGDAPFPVYSGSWSDEHEETWRAYIVSGGKKFADSSGEYIYNRYPVRPLYETSVWIKENWKKYFAQAVKEIKI